MKHPTALGFTMFGDPAGPDHRFHRRAAATAKDEEEAGQRS
ncbi:hypothetical protein [Prosthecobacter sp.]|nr:hypothetical protein [Prosthecobacter sp.]